MPAAFPPMESHSPPIRGVKFNSRSPSTGPPGIEPRGEYAVDGPAAAGKKVEIGGKAEKRQLTKGNIKHRQAGPFGSCCRRIRPRREHGESAAPCSRYRPSTPVNTIRRVDSTRLPRAARRVFDYCRRFRGWPHLIMRGESPRFPLAAITRRGHHEGMCWVLTATRYARRKRT